MAASDVPTKIITCYIPSEKAEALLHYLAEAPGVVAVNHAAGRGDSASGAFGLANEIAMFSVAAAADRADEVFVDIFEHGEIDRPNGGIVFMQRTRRATRFELPDLPEEGD
jgi:hypothetical protein